MNKEKIASRTLVIFVVLLMGMVAVPSATSLPTGVAGVKDSMVIARAKNRKDLDDLSKNVLSIDGVERSITHLVLNTVKEKTASLPE